VFHVISEVTREPVENPVARVISLGQVVGLGNHTILVDRHGRERAIDDSAGPIRDKANHIVGVVLVFRDVAARRETELRMARSERELADFFENATVPMHWIGPDGNILRANRAELQMLGYSDDEYIGHNISEFHVDEAQFNALFQSLTSGDSLHDFAARMRCRNGSIRDVLISSSVYYDSGSFRHTRCQTLDITDRKRAEEQLRESEERFRRMADAAPVLIWLSGPDKQRIWFNRTWLEFVGRTMEQDTGDGWLENVHPDDATSVCAVITRRSMLASRSR
jgi:PAS domain S-box-containing protein